jgi:hypothetical protein
LSGTIWMQLMTFQVAGRYTNLGFTFLYVLTIIFIAGKDVVPKGVKLLLVLFGFGHAWWVVDSLAGNLKRNPLDRFYWNSSEYQSFPGYDVSYVFSPHLEEERFPLLLKEISHVVDLREEARILTFLESMDRLRGLSEISMVSQEMGHRAHFEHPHELLFGGAWVGADFDWRKARGEYIIIGYSERNPELNAWRNMNLMANIVVRLWKSGQLESHGLKFLKKVQWKDQDLDVLIFKIDRSLPGRAT